MAGLERIIQDILSEANRSADEIKADAAQNAERTVADAKRVSEERLAESKKRTDADVRKQQKRIDSSVEAKHRLVLLTEKQRIIQEALSKAYADLVALPQAEYEAFLVKLFAKNLHAGDCSVIFSERDKARLSQTCLDEMKKIAAEKDAHITFSSEVRSMDGGFVLSYGGVEENCSFDALFEAEKNRLSDRANAILFPDAK